jgi:hypothetical protein
MQKQARLATFAPLALAAALAGCGGGPPPAAPEATPPPQPAAAVSAKPTAPPGQLPRGALEDVLAQGPPWLLRRVPVEEVIRGGNFIGWKILAMPESWRDAALKPGDVITKVNGKTLERPDDLFEAWRALVTAKELRIAYEREGAERELVVPIAGEPSPALVRAFEQGGPQPQPQQQQHNARKKGVVVIEEDDGTPPLGDGP